MYICIHIYISYHITYIYIYIYDINLNNICIYVPCLLSFILKYFIYFKFHEILKFVRCGPRQRKSDLRQNALR